MLITKDFIVINNPKTGSSFVRKVLKKIYTQREQKYSWLKKKSIAWQFIPEELIELKIRPIVSTKLPPNQHGAVSQIPEKYAKNKAIVSVVRNLYTKILSQYEFKWWQTNYHLFANKELIDNTFPNFPNLSLEEYVDFKIINTNYKYPNTAEKKNRRSNHPIYRNVFLRPYKNNYKY